MKLYRITYSYDNDPELKERYYKIKADSPKEAEIAAQYEVYVISRGDPFTIHKIEIENKTNK